MVFSAIVHLNEPEIVIKVLGEDTARKVVERINSISDTVTLKERREMAQNLLIVCSNYILSKEDDG